MNTNRMLGIWKAAVLMSGRALLLAPLAALSLEIAAKAEDVGGKSCDVIVIGASPSGIAAAVAARREGSSVVLVEQQP